MRNRFDYVIKKIGKKALDLCGTTVTRDVINPATQYADLRHEPDPARHQARQRIGLLGQLANCPCLLEPYSRAPTAEEVRACLTKHLAVWRQRERKVRSDSRVVDRRGARRHAMTGPPAALIALSEQSPTVRELAAGHRQRALGGDLHYRTAIWRDRR